MSLVADLLDLSNVLLNTYAKNHISIDDKNNIVLDTNENIFKSMIDTSIRWIDNNKTLKDIEKMIENYEEEQLSHSLWDENF